MKQTLLLFFCLFTFGALYGQTVILNFETPATSTTYQYFGSSIDGQLGKIIDNPKSGGINTSAKVHEHIKPAAAQTWAGAFPNPTQATLADFLKHSEICMKVWSPKTGNVGIKLEQSTNGGKNWIRTADITEANKWVEVCIKVDQPSIEDPKDPAANFIYKAVVLFFDFGTSPTADVTYYFDDIVAKGQGSALPGDITFKVNMKNHTGAYSKVYVSGTFNNWSDSANELLDPDGDKIFEAKVTGIPVGTHEYKFQLDKWANQESFNGLEVCVIKDPSGQFVNRKVIVTGNKVLDPVCYNSCYNCGDAVKITWNVGTSHIQVNEKGIHIAGGGNFGNPGDFPMKNNNGVYSITFEKQKGFTSNYTFTNGACPDWSCKENIGGQACADAANFNDRKLGPVTKDTILNTCFAVCLGTTNCADAPKPGMINFKVDMSKFVGTFNKLFVSGTFNNWSADANPLTDANGDKIWETTFLVSAGKHEFKYQVDGWAKDEQFQKGDPCTVTDPSGQFVNRVIDVKGNAIICHLWGSCTACATTNTTDVITESNMFSVSPTVVNDYTSVRFNVQLLDSKILRVYNSYGVLVQEYKVPVNSYEQRISTSDLVAGIYIIHVQSGKLLSTRKVMKQ